MAHDLGDLVGNADVFPVLSHRDYFNHAGVSPMPRPVADAVRRFLAHFQDHAFIGYDIPAPGDKLRRLAATLIRSDPDEIGIVTNTSEAISHIALGIPLEAGDRVVISDAEYPANVYPWQEACRRSGAELVTVPETTRDDGVAVVEEAALLEACSHPKTKVLAVSHVQWGSGQRMDLNRLGTFCRDNDILFSVDAIQSLGVVPIDVRRDHIDFLQAGGHKWMLGTMGAAPLFVRKERLEMLRPVTVGWGSVVEPLKWEEIDYTLQDTPRRFEVGSPGLAAIEAVSAGLELLENAGISEVHARVKSLGDRFVDGVTGAGYRVVTRRDRSDAETCGGAICFLPPGGEDQTKHVYHAMAKDHDTELASRCGRLRFSPHFYNTEEQVDRCVERLGSVLPS